MKYKDNQKKEYSKPLVRIVVFNYRDVVMASGEEGGDVKVGSGSVSTTQYSEED